jgi:hypothetical protein
MHPFYTLCAKDFVNRTKVVYSPFRFISEHLCVGSLWDSLVYMWIKCWIWSELWWITKWKEVGVEDKVSTRPKSRKSHRVWEWTKYTFICGSGELLLEIDSVRVGVRIGSYVSVYSWFEIWDPELVLLNIVHTSTQVILYFLRFLWPYILTCAQ